ncbi:protocatechuate 3,4-dioxygenase subunit alpha [Paradevosia shaoguanensis]|uniref:protocatechuate 3,4-dioxygenase subunit alpha n=1 Tax=Paradevosia shaoguanensis TaxID=1335043 RepID=UPI001931C2C7|nr:protocatechuate 3,4-dioxygenase subunit alpha [Paradevosia shaoguanensis]
MLNRIAPLKETPSQTGGPYVHIGLVPSFSELHVFQDGDLGATMLTPETKGERIVVTTNVYDGSGLPLIDAVVEVWQADADGLHVAAMSPRSNSAPAFTGWGRQATDTSGQVRFETIKPGRVSGPDGKPMAPHLTLWIAARGINTGLHTRLYFDDERDANAGDFVLNRIMDPRRRQTLIAARDTQGGMPHYHLNIRLQGDDETVFFDI